MSTKFLYLGQGLVLFALVISPTAKATTFSFESDNNGTIPVFPGTTASGWYTPTVTGAVPAKIDAYTDLSQNGFALDPNGGLQFLGLANTSDPATATRAQHQFAFNGITDWTAGYDFFALNTGGTTTSYGNSYIGSFSVQQTNPGSSSFFNLAAWDSSAANSTYSSTYVVYDAAGNQNSGAVAGAAWTGLSQDHWYNETTSFNTATNMILSVSITDLTTGNTTTVAPTGWYLLGGAGQTFQANSIRFSGYAATNGFGIDNVSVFETSPEPGSLGLIGLGIAGLGFALRLKRS